MSRFLHRTMIAGGLLLGANHATNLYAAKRLKEHIQAVDQTIVGTDIWIQGCKVNCLQGIVNLTNVEVANPKEDFIKNPNLMTIGKVVFDLDMVSLLWKGTVEIEEFTLQHVKILVENEEVWGPDILFGRSNICVMLDRINNLPVDDVPVPENTAEMPDPKVIQADDGMKIRKLEIEGLEADLNGIVAGLCDIKYSDFSKEIGVYFLDDFIAILIRSVLKNCKKAVIAQLKFWKSSGTHP